jgi:hypothetical protein
MLRPYVKYFIYKLFTARLGGARDLLGEVVPNKQAFSVKDK